MKTFQGWMEERHPEAIEEGFLKKAATAGILAGALMGGLKKFDAGAFHAPRATATSNDFDGKASSMTAKEAKLQAAAQRVGIPRSQWNNLRGHMTGGVVTVVNGKKVPLTPKEAEQVKWTQDLGRRMGN
jgi:hypothetical protein